MNDMFRLYSNQQNFGYNSNDKPQATSHKPQATSHKPQQHSESGLVCKKTVGAVLTAGFVGIALGHAGTAQAANSARVQYPANGHFYQLFEGALITWGNARAACQSKSAHLVTLTSDGEQGFVQSQLLAGRNNDNSYAIGGTSTDTYTWTWITGETWRYAYWNSAARHGIPPAHDSGRNYLYLHVKYGGDATPGGWFNGQADSTYTGYICEWSTQDYISTALVPDLNGNGIAEVAALYVDYKTGKHTVQIKDPRTDKLVNTLVFATSFTPMVVLKDINGNRSPEIGVLSTQYNFPSVHIKDAKTGATLNNMIFLTPDYKPKSVGTGADSDKNGADDIVVLGVHKSTGAAKALIRDSKTGALLNETPF